jgi:hypothetical protein
MTLGELLLGTSAQSYLPLLSDISWKAGGVFINANDLLAVALSIVCVGTAALSWGTRRLASPCARRRKIRRLGKASNARVLDVEAGRYHDDRFVAITDGRIAAISDAKPRGAGHEIDLGGRVLMPGLSATRTCMRRR